jgi:hypothetical protein
MIIKIFCLLLCIFCFSELQNITAAQFLVLKDSTRTYAHLEDVIEAIVPNFKISRWKNINKLATKHCSRENYDYSVIQEDTSDPFSVGHVDQKMDLISTSLIHSLKLNKSILSESLRDSVEDNIACDTEKRTKQENRALKSTIDNMFNGQLAFQSKANICG